MGVMAREGDLGEAVRNESTPLQRNFIYLRKGYGGILDQELPTISTPHATTTPHLGIQPPTLSDIQNFEIPPRTNIDNHREICF
jgi:hypothetical protein